MYIIIIIYTCSCNAPTNSSLLYTCPEYHFIPSVKLGVHVYNRFHNNHLQKSPQALLFRITSSLLKLTNGSTHGGEAWYACVFNCFHDNHQAQVLFFLQSSDLLTVACMEMKLIHVYFIVFMTTTYKNEWRQVNQKSYGLKKGEHIEIV